MSRLVRLASMTALAVVALGRAPEANRNFAPDWTFTGSSLAAADTLGAATWTAANGEITGTPSSPEGGFLLLGDAIQDVQVAASFSCAAGCQAGFILRLERTPDGYKGVLASITETPGAFAVTLDAQGHITSKEPLERGGGMVRFLPPPAAGGRGDNARAGGAGRGGDNARAGGPGRGGDNARAGGPGRGGRGGRGGAFGGLPEGAPYTRPDYAFRPGEWNTLESIMDTNILRTWLNDGPEAGVASGRVDTDTARYGRIGLYVAGTTPVRFRAIERKDLGIHTYSDEKVGPNFRMQRIEDFYYAWSATAADVNKDGVLDVVAGPRYYLGPDYRVAREIYLTNISNPSEDYVAAAVNFAYDYTRDGYSDVLVTEGRNFVLYVNPGTEVRRWDRYPAVSNSSEANAFGDVDGDGVPDIGILNGGYVSYATVDKTDPTRPWTVHHVSGPGYTVVSQHSMGIGDVNGDGRNDLLNAYGWWEHPASAGDAPWPYHPVAFGRWPRAGASPGGAELRVVDINGDGRNDVVTSLEAHGWGLAWFEQTRSASGEIGWTEHIIMDGPNANNPGNVAISELHALTTADVDGDGVADIITGKRAYAHLDSRNDPDPYGDPALYVFRTVRDRQAPGGARFVPELVHNRSGVGSSLQTADLNKDGVVDIMTGTTRGTFIFFGTRRPARR